MAMIHIEDLCKSYGDNLVFKNVNADIEKGDCVCIIGPSGCGKSTFLRCLNRLEQPSSGRVFIDGEEITAKKAPLDKIRRKMGMVYQTFNLFSHKTILENVMMAPMQLGGLSKKEAYELAMDCLSQVGMAERADYMPQQLSGGQKQRLCIARTLLKHPKVLIFDDSTSAVDTATESGIRHALAGLGSVTKLIIAQRITSVQSADLIVILDDGRLHAVGTHDELLAKDTIYQEIYHSQMKGGDADGEAIRR